MQNPSIRETNKTERDISNMKSGNLLIKSIKPVRNSLNRSSGHGGWIAGLLTTLLLAWFALSPQARAGCQEGCLTNNNTVLGDNALLNNTAFGNTAIGFNALFTNTTGGQNTALGYQALYSNSTGIIWGASSSNTALGYQALYSNTGGAVNTAIGSAALKSNTTGVGNTATGAAALVSNTTGGNNTATGYAALNFNTTGIYNTATGADALQEGYTGSFNTATGASALLYNDGNYNIAVGFQAGLNLSTGDNNIDIGNVGVAGESNTIRIGTSGTQIVTYLAGVRGAAIAGGQPVSVNANGQLGVRASSARFKDKIRPIGKASEAILALKPVTFRYKQELDPDGTRQFGLVAEEVARVNADLVDRDADGKPYTVRYEAVNAMLLNEFLKEHHTVSEQKAAMAQIKSTVAKQDATIAQQQKEIQALTATLKEQSSQIQKVSAQLEARKPFQQVVVNER